MCVLLALSARGLARRSRHHKRCVGKEEMELRAQKHLRKYVTEAAKETLGAPEGYGGGQSCSGFQLQASSAHHSNRSVSPWRYRIDRDEDRYPSVMAVAECLCEGCIINGVEDTTYNSVPVTQVKKVLRRLRCSTDPDRYYLKTAFVEVAVACTCVIPRQ
ncbi:interleukin-17C-like [Arapaima gigas]